MANWVFIVFSCLILITTASRGIETTSDVDDDDHADGHLIDLNVNEQSDDYTDSYLRLNRTNIILSMQNVECVKCRINKDVVIRDDGDEVGGNTTIRINTMYPNYYIIIRDLFSKRVICDKYSNKSFKFEEVGVYYLKFNYESDSTTDACTIVVITKPNNIYIPIIVMVIILASVALLYITVLQLYKKFQSRHNRVFEAVSSNESDTHNDMPNVVNELVATLSVQQEQQQQQRFHSIDTYRGVCLFLMIFVNYGAGGYSFLDHSIWNGLHLADLLFPSFVFIMGVSIAFASKYNSKRFELHHILERFVLLFFFGLLTSNNYTIVSKDIRIMGVLQRLAISYLVCALLMRVKNFENHFYTRFFKEIVYYPIQWTVIVVFTVVWISLTFYLPIDNNCPRGYLGPGGEHENGVYANCTGGAAGYIDRVIFGESHLYQYPTFKSMYKTRIAYDPEGLLGCLTSCILTYIGISAGHILIHYSSEAPIKRVLKFFFYSIFYGTCALVLCKWSRDDGWIPINKNLWSLSFILALASIGFLFIILFYLICDVFQLYSGKPFIFLGKNSICIYICHIVFANFFPIQFYVPGTHGNLLTMHLYGALLWSFVAYYLYRKKIFISL